MKKCEKNKKKKLFTGISVIFGMIVLVALVLFVMPQVLYRMNGDTDKDEFVQESGTESQSTETQKQDEEESSEPESIVSVSFPITLEDENIEIESLFLYSGVNPDAEKQEETDTAAIVLKNISNEYIDHAAVTAVLSNGTELSFVTSDIPAGTSVMAFSADNKAILPKDVCVDIASEVVFAETPQNDSIEYSVAGTEITIKNTSSEDLDEINVYYRDIFDGKYFGSMPYKYTIGHLSAGESIIVLADKSLMGVIEVVRIVMNKKN